MPSIAFKSKVRTSSEHCTLTLIIRHLLVVGQPSETVHDMRLSLPEPVDILLDSQLVITISGMLNGVKIAPAVLLDSCITLHLQEYLRLNAHELGINAVSDTHISGDTGLLTCSRPFPTAAAKNPLRTMLVGFDLNYIWKTAPGVSASQAICPQITATMNPFSRKRLPLPYLTAVNNIIERFVTFQLVKRYPLIFGSWCQQLDVETRFTTSIYKSISRIISRSPHPEFQSTCKILLKVCRKQLESASMSVVAALSDYLGPAGKIDAQAIFSDDEENEISMMMANFFRLGLRRPLFKGLSLFCIPEDEEDIALFDELPEPGGHGIQFDVDSYSKTHQTSMPQHPDLNLNFDDAPEDANNDSDSLDCLDQYTCSPSLHSCDGKRLLGGLRPTLPECGPEALLAMIGSKGFSDLIDGDDIDNEVDVLALFSSKNRAISDDYGHSLMESKTSNNWPPIHKGSSIHRGWSADVEPSQEKLNHSSMGMSITHKPPHKLPGPCLPRIGRIDLDPNYHEASTNPPLHPPPSCHSELSEYRNDSDFEDAPRFSLDAKENSLEFETSTTLQFDFDSGSDSMDSDDHGIIEFKWMGSESLTPMTPRSVISPEEHPGYGTVQEQIEDDSDTTTHNGQREFLAAVRDNGGFLIIDF